MKRKAPNCRLILQLFLGLLLWAPPFVGNAQESPSEAETTLSVRVKTRGKGLTVRSQEDVSTVIGSIPNGQSVRLDPDYLLSLLQSTDSGTRKSFLSQPACQIFGKSWKNLHQTEKAVLPNQNSGLYVYHFVGVLIDVKDENGKVIGTKKGRMALEFLEAEFNCDEVAKSITERALPCLNGCYLKNTEEALLSQDIAEVVSHFIDPEHKINYQEEALALVEAATSLCNQPSDLLPKEEVSEVPDTKIATDDELEDEIENRSDPIKLDPRLTAPVIELEPLIVTVSRTSNLDTVTPTDDTQKKEVIEPEILPVTDESKKEEGVIQPDTIIPLSKPEFSFDREVNCGSDQTGLWTNEELDQVIAYYQRELGAEGFKAKVEELLKNPTPEQSSQMGLCDQIDSLCLLNAYWKPTGENSEENAKRALALYLEANVLPRRTGNLADQLVGSRKLLMVERSLRRLPQTFLETIKRGLPIQLVSRDIERSDDPKAAGKLFSDEGHPTVIFTENTLLRDRRTGRPFDGNTTYFLHELGHIIDGNLATYSLGELKEDGYRLASYGRQFNDSFSEINARSVASVAFPGNYPARASKNYNCSYVKDYKGNDIFSYCDPSELFADAFAKYLTFPIALKSENPGIYDYFKNKVFKEENDRSFSSCFSRR